MHFVSLEVFFRRYKGLNVLFHLLVLGQNHVKTPEECKKKYSNSMGKLFFSFVVGISCGIALCDLSHFIKEAFSLSGQTMIHKMS